jgi:hypothetical protein
MCCLRSCSLGRRAQAWVSTYAGLLEDWSGTHQPAREGCWTASAPRGSQRLVSECWHKRSRNSRYYPARGRQRCCFVFVLARPSPCRFVLLRPERGLSSLLLVATQARRGWGCASLACEPRRRRSRRRHGHRPGLYVLLHVRFFGCLVLALVRCSLADSMLNAVICC